MQRTAIGLLVALGGCAQVTSLPLTASGQIDTTQQPGIRYYLPKPYLLVAEVPVDPKVTETQESEDPKKGVAYQITTGGGSTSKPKKGDKGSSSDQSKAASSGSSAGAADTSFSMMTQQYGFKLIYLPDYAHPMALKADTGLFGSVEIKPTLADGWMLTGIDASSDSKVAETLSAISSLVSAAEGGGAATGTSAAAHSFGAKLAAHFAGTPATTAPILPPGLYELNFDAGGKLTGISRVVYFCNSGVSLSACN
jgi:hypothetical protein